MNETAANDPIVGAPRKRRTISAAQALRRRIRNRENMRHRRQDPAFREFEKRRRDWKDYGPEQERFFEGAGGWREIEAEMLDLPETRGGGGSHRLRPCAEVRGG
jgi:hypothetical protein